MILSPLLLLALLAMVAVPTFVWMEFHGGKRGQWAAANREKVIQETARLDGPDVNIWIEQEPGSGGKESAENTIRRLPGYSVHADRVTGNNALAGGQAPTRRMRARLHNTTVDLVSAIREQAERTAVQRAVNIVAKRVALKKSIRVRLNGVVIRPQNGKTVR